MRSIYDYLRLAAARYGAANDNQLAKALGTQRQNIQEYQSGRVFPREDMFLRLAELAGIDEFTAMLDLALWRAERNKQWLAVSVLKDHILARDAVEAMSRASAGQEKRARNDGGTTLHLR